MLYLSFYWEGAVGLLEGDVDREAAPMIWELLGLTKGDTEDAVGLLQGDIDREAVPVIGQLFGPMNGEEIRLMECEEDGVTVHLVD